MASVLSRYMLKAHATPAVTQAGNASCPSSPASFSTHSSVKFYVDVSRDHALRLLGPLLSADGSAGEPVERSQILTMATYDAAGQRVHVPAGLFNTSVPANTSHFSLHFARFAVRFYGALVEMIMHRDAVQPALRYDDDLLSRFEDLLDCFEWELRQLPAGLRQPVAPDSATTRGSFLQQTVAVQLAFRAFQELMQIRRTWNLDFRFARLPSLSADQLFFVYYALDNCEAADRVYQEHRGHRLLCALPRQRSPPKHCRIPGHIRVRAGLRHGARGVCAGMHGRHRRPVGPRVSFQSKGVY
ncbi:hypothetical protein HPB48_021608 [Haemaphysalis longicornis]|uniref:Uncharacterized protein n=1 Tax=Haemaphysalis longicornis TaxID=44386 RepID=A0A9J6GBP7_HAELO|nr:hypothetical protein HPB48_021608 [Haemaphysalis longicornis]